MGNTPTKESRPRASSLSLYGHGAGASSSRHSRRHTLSSSGQSSRSSNKPEDKLKSKEKHFMDLVVRYQENVDGGYLAPHGIYKSNVDFDTQIVRSLILDRRLAPFYTPLQDFDSSWTEDEIVTLVGQVPLRALDTAYEDEEETEDADDHKIHRSSNYYKRQEQKRLHQEMLNRVKQEQRRCEVEHLEVRANQVPDPNIASRDLVWKMYRDASECPICFLYYPTPLNYSRCCRQPICTECFVQIRRLDPHPPHDDIPSNGDELPHTLVSEFANCPYCAMSNFGVTYDPPSDLRVGLGSSTKPSEYKAKTSFEVIPEDETAVDSTDEVDGAPSPPKSPVPTPIKKPRRRSSIAADSDLVITTDHIRPDWEQKLTTAINRLARKAATASAIYASNLIVEDSGSSNNARSAREQNNAYLASLEERMLAEAMRLSLLDEEQRASRAQRSDESSTS